MAAVEVTVLFFARARELAGSNDTTLSLPAGSTSADALAKLLDLFPSLSELSGCSVLAVNHEYVSRDVPVALKTGDEVAFIPPISGG